jgi:hypothetical protein
MNNEKVVLIVDDSATVRFQVKTLLKFIGVGLREAGGEIGVDGYIRKPINKDLINSKVLDILKLKVDQPK